MDYRNQLYSVQKVSDTLVLATQKDENIEELRSHFKKLGYERIRCYKGFGTLAGSNYENQRKIRIIPPVLGYPKPNEDNCLLENYVIQSRDYGHCHLYIGPIYSVRLPYSGGSRATYMPFGFILRDDYLAFLKAINTPKKDYQEILTIIPDTKFIYLCSQMCEQFDRNHMGTICPVSKPRSLENFLYTVLLQRMVDHNYKMLPKGITVVNKGGSNLRKAFSDPGKQIVSARQIKR